MLSPACTKQQNIISDQKLGKTTLQNNYNKYNKFKLPEA
jgi:hypothetical protein